MDNGESYIQNLPIRMVPVICNIFPSNKRDGEKHRLYLIYREYFYMGMLFILRNYRSVCLGLLLRVSVAGQALSLPSLEVRRGSTQHLQEPRVV